MKLNDFYTQSPTQGFAAAVKVTENRQHTRKILAKARQAHLKLMEQRVYRDAHQLGRMLSERLLQPEEVAAIW